MKLRPHHLLCIQKYTGKGYDGPFTVNMNGLIDRLKADPDGEIRLVTGEDDVCAACPHNDGGRCASQEKVTRMDRDVLAACGLAYEQRSSWRTLSRLTAERVLRTEAFEQICGTCQWVDLCRETKEGWIDGNQG